MLDRSNFISLILSSLIKFKSAADMAHLRRFALPEHVPNHVGALFSIPRPDDTPSSPMSDISGEPEGVHYNPFLPPDGNEESEETPVKNTNWRLFLVCDDSCISLSNLTRFLSSNLPGLSVRPEIHVIPVPRYGPTSKEKADSWSESHWPTVYRFTNPFGPHPTIVSRAEKMISVDYKQAMNLAYTCANMVQASQIGEGIGCLIIHRDWNETATYVAAAGDTRHQPHRPHSRTEPGSICPEGNTMCHAVLRAIGMVARKQREANAIAASQSTSGIYPITCAICRREDLDEHYHCDVCLDGQYDMCPKCYQAGHRCWEGTNHDEHALKYGTKSDQKPRRPTSGRWIDADAPKRRPIPLPDKGDDEALGDEVDFFMDKPLPDCVESDVYYGSRLNAGGYLCTSMEIYITHEPCVMCCQAMLHSRFERIIFCQRMPHTGALSAEKDRGLGYGQWWRRELNWRALAWELQLGKNDVNRTVVDGAVHA